MVAYTWLSISIVLFAFHRQASSEEIPFSSCGEKQFLSVHITPCNGTIIDEKQTCVLMHGDSISFEAFFNATFNSSSLQLATMITLDGMEVPSINSGYDPCYGYISPPCPVTEGVTYLFHRYYRVQSEFPVGLMDLRLVVQDMETKEVAACAKFPVLIAKNPEWYYP